MKQLGLRVRADADVDAIAARLRATPDAVQAWLDGRIRQQSAKVTTAKTKPATKAAADALVKTVSRPVIVDAGRFLAATLGADPRVRYLTVGVPR